MTEYYAGFTEEDIEFLESIGRNVDDYKACCLVCHHPPHDGECEFPVSTTVRISCGCTHPEGIK